MSKVISQGILHFTVDEGINDIIRQAYWYENRQEWALETLDCFMGITQEQKMAILNGDTNLVPIEDGTRMTLSGTPDFEFQAELHKHQKWLEETHVSIGGKQVSKDIYDLYMENLRKLWLWKQRGQEKFVSIVQKILNDYHNIMAEQAGFRFITEGTHRHMVLDEPEYMQEAREKFETTFSVKVEAQLAEWDRIREEIENRPQDKETLLLPADYERALDLHNEIVLICYGDNSRPDLKIQEAALQVFDEIAEIVERYKDFYTDTSYGKRFLEKKALNRRMIKDCMDWNTLDTVRATIHSLIITDNSHGDTWKEKD